jgi:hypothetical protein
VVGNTNITGDHLTVKFENVLDVDCQTQGRLKFLIELYVGEKSVINSTYFISAPSYFSRYCQLNDKSQSTLGKMSCQNSEKIFKKFCQKIN